MGNIRVAILTLCIFYLAGFGQLSFADDAIVIVVGRSSTLQNISLETLKHVYLRKTLLNGNGERWIPLNLPPSHELRQAFSMAIFKTLPEDQEDYWNSQYFNGINPPEVVASEEAVMRFVMITPGSIGYVRKRNADERVKILKVLPIAGQN